MNSLTAFARPDLLQATSQPRDLPLAPAQSSIVCGTDYSENAAMAVEVAGVFAKKLAEPLVLVHAINGKLQAPLPADLRDALCFFERAQLYEELREARAAGAEAVEFLRTGRAGEVLQAAAETHHGRMFVLSSHRRSRPARWVLGSVAEEVAESARMPTLIVRHAAPFVAWHSRKRRLKVFVGADLSTPSDSALRWVHWLCELGSCDITAVFCQPDEWFINAPYAIPSPVVLDVLTETHPARRRLFRKRVRDYLGTQCARIRVEEGWGRSDAHFLHLAKQNHADLIVIGTHQRHGLARLGHHSFSRGVLHYAQTNVACVPYTGEAERCESAA